CSPWRPSLISCGGSRSSGCCQARSTPWPAASRSSPSSGGWVAACTRRFSPDALRVYFGACAWILTAHYFYLFQGNRGQLDWIIGAYVTVLAISQTFLTLRALLAYSLYVTLLGGAMLAILPPLRQTVLLPGLLTFLALVCIGARTREPPTRQPACQPEGRPARA